MTLIIYLDNFRSHESASFTLNPGINLIHGPNGSGKTSIVEALSLLMPGTGLRKAKSSEMIRYGSDYWSILIGLNDNKIKISYLNNTKQVLWNGGKVSSQELLEGIGIGWLTPQMMFSFWKETRSRRHMLDRITSTHFPSYSYHYLYYEKLRSSRNKLLHNGSNDKNAYQALENLMVLHGIEIMKSRKEVIRKLNMQSDYNLDISLYGELEVALEDLVSKHGDEAGLKELRLHWLQKLASSRNTDSTNIGPHRTDLRVKYKGFDGLHASTGEQNTIIISLLIRSFEILEQSTKILLLDDIFSHLDEHNRNIFLELIDAKLSEYYVCITDVNKLELGNGNFIPLK